MDNSFCHGATSRVLAKARQNTTGKRGERIQSLLFCAHKPLLAWQGRFAALTTDAGEGGLKLGHQRIINAGAKGKAEWLGA